MSDIVDNREARLPASSVGSRQTPRQKQQPQSQGDDGHLTVIRQGGCVLTTPPFSQCINQVADPTPTALMPPEYHNTTTFTTNGATTTIREEKRADDLVPNDDAETSRTLMTSEPIPCAAASTEGHTPTRAERQSSHQFREEENVAPEPDVTSTAPLSPSQVLGSPFPVCEKNRGPLRESHNMKERRRRARIKHACNLMRQLVPGMSYKTDKATVLEFSARYIHFLKSFVGTHNDKEFLVKYSPY